MKYKTILALLSLSILAFSCNNINSASNAKPLNVVENVDVKKYLGKWYEIASIPIKEQEGCVASTATYSLKDNGDIKVFNECRNKTLDGELRSVEGFAWVEDKKSNAKLKVTFFWPFAADYWIIDLDKDYKYAVVGSPTRKYAWVLSRTPSISEDVYQDILKRLSLQDYDVSKLKKTIQ